MFSTLIIKELKSILQSPKFTATFITSSLLILLSVYIGIREFNYSVKSYETGMQLSENENRKADAWFKVRYNAFRKPDPVQIFSSGTNNDIGRYSRISSRDQIKLQNSVYSDDPIYAIFRNIDFVFIVTVILSLFAILFTYDSINGEKESGTLKLVFSNSVSRAKYIAAKFIGGWLGLAVPVLIPVLMAVLMLIIFRVPMSPGNWISLVWLLLLSFLYFTVFIGLGILLSALTRHSSVSFLLALVIWIVFVFILPRAGVMIAGQFVKVSSVAEQESQINAFQKERWEKYFTQIQEVWKKRNEAMQDMTPAQRETYQDDNSLQWIAEEDELRKKVDQDINEFSARVKETADNSRQRLEKLGLNISRFSPASAYQLSAMNLSRTDIAMKQRYENAMTDFKKTYTDFIDKQISLTGNRGGLRISFDSEKGLSISDSRNQSAVDASLIPKFTDPVSRLSDISAPLAVDFGVLLLFIIASFGWAFAAFIRYDLR